MESLHLLLKWPGSEREIPCELALLAMGFVHPQYEGLLQQLDVELDERRNVRATEKTYHTNINKILQPVICAVANH